MDSKTASDQLNRILGFFPRVDGKASAVFAIASTLIGVLASRINFVQPSLPIVALPACVSLALLAYALIELFICAYPNLRGSETSLIYFRGIARRDASSFCAAFSALNEQGLQDDLIEQIWCNARILRIKYGALKRAFIATLTALIPWTLVISLTNAG